MRGSMEEYGKYVECVYKCEIKWEEVWKNVENMWNVFINVRLKQKLIRSQI